MKCYYCGGTTSRIKLTTRKCDDCGAEHDSLHRELIRENDQLKKFIKKMMEDKNDK